MTAPRRLSIRAKRRLFVAVGVWLLLFHGAAVAWMLAVRNVLPLALLLLVDIVAVVVWALRWVAYRIWPNEGVRAADEAAGEEGEQR